MVKKTTITLDSELRTKLYILKNDYNLKSMEDIINALYESKDDKKLNIYVKNAIETETLESKKSEDMLRTELIDKYGFFSELVDNFSSAEVMNAHKAAKKESLEQ